MALINFLASSPGRAVRVVAGALLIVVGALVIGGIGGLVVVLIGLVPLLAGMFDFCLFAPLFGAPFSGKAIRGE